MIKTIVSSHIPYKVDLVFQHISHLENMVEYNSSVLKSELIKNTASIFPYIKLKWIWALRGLQANIRF
jgi:hypothetical protein